MNQCKPCITIRMVLRLMKHHWTLFVNDVRSHSKVNQIACEIDVNPELQAPVFKGHDAIAKVRKLAQKHHVPPKDNGWPAWQTAEVVEKLVEEYKTGLPRRETV